MAAHRRTLTHSLDGSTQHSTLLHDSLAMRVSPSVRVRRSHQSCSGKFSFGGTPPSLPLLPLRSRLPLIQLGSLGSAVSSPSGQRPGCKRILEHFRTPEAASGDTKFCIIIVIVIWGERCPVDCATGSHHACYICHCSGVVSACTSHLYCMSTAGIDNTALSAFGAVHSTRLSIASPARPGVCRPYWG